MAGERLTQNLYPARPVELVIRWVFNRGEIFTPLAR
jgi:hypothetical protein